MWSDVFRALAAACALAAAMSAAAADRTFTTSDGVRLHYTDAGRGDTLVFIPGWTMPARIFEHQLAHFARTHRVIGFDPRSQGASAIAPGGHEPARRGRDIAELLAHLRGTPPVLVGWSLGVLDSLAYVRASGDAAIAGMVLIDSSVGEEPRPTSSYDMPAALRRDRAGTVKSFVRGMYKRPQPQAYLDDIARASMRTPLDAAIRLISYDWPRERWKESLYSSAKPVLYVVTPRWAEQADNVRKNHPNAMIEVFTDAGHALFVDEPALFNATVERFLAERVWPAR